MKINVETITVAVIIKYSFMVLYVTFIFLMAGIDKENLKIDKLVSIYGIVIAILYIINLYRIEQISIYKNAIYLIFYIIVLILDTITLKRYAKDSYTIGILLTVITMAIFTGEYITASTIIFTLIILFFYMLIYKLKQIKSRRKRQTQANSLKQLSIGFYLGVANIIMFLLVSVISNYNL